MWGVFGKLHGQNFQVMDWNATYVNIDNQLVQLNYPYLLDWVPIKKAHFQVWSFAF